jgi:A/G-specific adenine glycosylase
VAGLRATVLGWGDAHRRDLPWRRTRDPWCILVSEVMLQQTSVARVLALYPSFVAAYPSPAECADAGRAAVVRSWAGLGYNRRAVALHRAAVAIRDEHAGRVPSARRELLALPGVGASTARAVEAFAFGADAGIVDTNVARLLARAVAARPLTRAGAQEFADALVPPGRGWEWNQTLFDLGAGFCRATGPRCGPCPLRRRCAWRRAGNPEPDPGRHTAGTTRPQGRFAGSDRQGRGRLVAALRRAPVAASGVAAAAGWPDDAGRAERVAAALVAEGLAVRGPAGTLALA